MFRFTVRDVVWLTVVVALGLGWCLHFERMNSALKAADARTDEVERFCETIGERVPWNEDRSHVVFPTQSPGYFP